MFLQNFLSNFMDPKKIIFKVRDEKTMDEIESYVLNRQKFFSWKFPEKPDIQVPKQLPAPDPDAYLSFFADPESDHVGAGGEKTEKS